MDILGDRYEVITAATGTLNTSGHKYYAFKAVGGSVTVTATADAGHSDNLTGWVLSNGDVLSSKAAWSSIEKTAGDGNIIAYYQ